jgi:hypothetical protein
VDGISYTNSPLPPQPLHNQECSTMPPKGRGNDKQNSWKFNEPVLLKEHQNDNWLGKKKNRTTTRTRTKEQKSHCWALQTYHKRTGYSESFKGNLITIIDTILPISSNNYHIPSFLITIYHLYPQYYLLSHYYIPH